MLVKYIGKVKERPYEYNFEELKSTIFNVVQFVPFLRHGQFGYSSCTMAICLAQYDYQWKSFPKDRHVRFSNINHKQIHTFDVSDIEIILESDIPEDVKRDMKLEFILK
jgi:hypothetical protein